MRRMVVLLLSTLLGVAAVGLAASPASATTAITGPAANPFTVPGSGSGAPMAFTVSASGFNPGESVFVEQCDGNPTTMAGWDPTSNCDLGTSPSPVSADSSGNVTFLSTDTNHAFTPFKGASPQGIFNCLSPTQASPNNGLPDYRACQLRVSTNNTIATSDQALLTLTLQNAAAQVNVVSGNNQIGISNSSFPKPFVAEVVDQNGAPLSGVSVQIPVAIGNSGAGTVTYTTVATVDGIAVSPTVRAGFPGAASPQAIVTGIPAATFSASVVNPQAPHLTDPSFSVGDASMTEGNAGSANLVFTVRLSRAQTTAKTVKYSVVGFGTATAGSDFTSVSNVTLTFAPGVVQQTIPVSVVGDATVEGDETFTVLLSVPTAGIALGRAVGAGIILNDD